VPGPVDGAGMRFRYSDTLDATGRYLRIGAAKGDSSYSMGEVQAFCQKPAEFPPKVDRKKGAVKDETAERNKKYANAKMEMGLIAFAAFFFLMVAPPKLARTNDAALERHYLAVAEAVDIPILLYNVPPRTGGDMQVETVIRLSQVRNIVGIKDASYDMARPTLTRLKAKKGFVQLSGEDASALGFLAQGGDGCISVTANVAPRLCGDMHDAWKKRDLDKAFELQDRLMPLHKAMFCETSPGPVKYAAELIGQCSAEMRLPMVPIAESSRKAVHEAMVHAGLIN
jgi:hypothetical protein